MNSEKINELANALTKVQSKLTPAVKNKRNPFFKSDYADLMAVWESCKTELALNGLCVIQTTDMADDGTTELITTLAHSSGQWISGRYPLKAIKQDPQGIGSAMTYARRYALMAIVGIVTDDDDDGEHAMGRAKHDHHKSTTPHSNALKTNSNKPFGEDELYPSQENSFFKAPEITPAMKARFEKVENEQIKAQVQSFIPEPLPFEETPAEEQVYVNGNTLVFHGKHKGKTFAEIPAEELAKSIWGAEKGLSEGAEWVDKMGVQHVQQFVQQAKAYLKSGK